MAKPLHAVRGLFRKLFTLEQWRIGIAQVPVAQFLAAPGQTSFRWVTPASRREILADPFAIETDGSVEVFAERLIYGATPGRLVRFALGPDEPRPLPFGAGPFHLSYPFVISDQGRRYLVPEQSQSGHLLFYSLGDTVPLDPVTVLGGLDAIDPTFVHHEGRWWLFCTRASDRPNEALHLYFADQLLGPYTPHPKNPVVVDRGRARPAGRIIAQEGKLLRPGQDCRETYGGAIALNEIELMTPADYRESTVARLTPDRLKGAWPDGVHTLEHTQSYVLIDTKRFVFHPLAFVFKLMDRLAGR